jgi:hypothetical protein
MKAKPTKAQVEARVDEILRIRLDGAEIWDVREYVREQEQTQGSHWHLAEGQNPLSDSQLWRYIAKSDRLLAETCRASRKKVVRRHLAQRRNLFAKALSAGDYRAALAAAESEARLQGLFEITPRAAKPEPIEKPEDVLRLLASSMADVRTGRLDHKTAASISNLAARWLWAAEFVDLAKRLEQAETIFRELKTHVDQGREEPHSGAVERGPDGEAGASCGDPASEVPGGDLGPAD